MYVNLNTSSAMALDKMFRTASDKKRDVIYLVLGLAIADIFISSTDCTDKSVAEIKSTATIYVAETLEAISTSYRELNREKLSGSINRGISYLLDKDDKGINLTADSFYSLFNLNKHFTVEELELLYNNVDMYNQVLMTYATFYADNRKRDNHD